MKDVIRELEQVRRRGLALLVLQRVFQWLAALLLIALVCGLLDFVLRLPGWFRLGVGVAVLVAAGTWIIRRMGQAMRFKPDLSVLALRAEHVYPQMAGALASTVEFTEHPDDYANPQRMKNLADQSVREAQGKLGGAPLKRLIDPTQTTRIAAIAAVAVLLFASVAAAAGSNAWLAAKRWAMPLSDVEWPRRTELVSLIKPGLVRPADMPVEVALHVDRGHHSGMRNKVHYRLLQEGAAASAWQNEMLNEAASGKKPRYEQLINFTPLLTDVLGESADVPGEGLTLEVYFQGGDHQTPVQRIRLVPRPALKRFEVSITPPAYAQGLADAQQVALQQQSGRVATASALQYAKVQVTLEVNKATPALSSDWKAVLPGFGAIDDVTVTSKPSAGDDATTKAGAATLQLSFLLKESIESKVSLVDEHGIRNLSERLYRIDATVDRAPVATMVEPRSDESVLATAVVDLEAVAKDDVGVEALKIESRVLRKDQPIEAPADNNKQDGPDDAIPADAPDAGADNAAKANKANNAGKDKRQDVGPPRTVIEQTSGRNPRLTTSAKLALKEMNLKAGDRVEITALANDVFAYEGQRHDAVRSTPRVLYIIDEATLMSQVRRDLAGIRQQAIRLEGKQDQLLKDAAKQEQGDQDGAEDPLDDPDGDNHQDGKTPEAKARAQRAKQERAINQQQRLTDSVRKQDELADALEDRLNRNGLNDDQMKQLLNRTRALLQKAGEASDKASKEMKNARNAKQQDSASKENQAKQEAKDQQGKAKQALRDLATLLDQGRDALALQLKLRDMKTQQESLQADARKLMPKTLGRDADKLDPKTKQELKDIANKQKELSDKAQELIQQMQSTADAIDKDAKRPQDKATARTLSEAARIAQRQGLQQKMQKASQKLQQNQMAQAGEQQQQSMEVLDKMLQEMKDQDQRKQEILKRLVAKLGESLRKLIEQQKAQLALLNDVKQDDKLAGLSQGLLQLRRNTMSVQEEAESSPKTAPVGELVGKAVESQGRAVQALRQKQRDSAEAGEKAAVAHLEAALAKLNELNKKNEQEQQQEKRENLRKKYVELLARQTAVREQVEKLAALDRLTRRQRAQLIGLSEEQDGIREEANKLGEKVREENVLVFDQVHTRIDRTAEHASERMQIAEADEDLLFQLRSLEGMFKLAADALGQDKKNDQWDRPPNQQQQQQGGGGQGQPKKPPLVPPVAELKALRGLQSLIYDQTRMLEKMLTKPGGARAQRALEEIGGEQRGLHDRGKELIKKLQQQMQQQRQPTPAKPDPADEDSPLPGGDDKPSE